MNKQSAKSGRRASGQSGKRAVRQTDIRSQILIAGLPVCLFARLPDCLKKRLFITNLGFLRPLLLIFIVGATFSTKSQAAQDATVVTDGAIVYKTANFDSGVLGYLRAGQQVRISNKTIGAFYRVKFKNRIGYISDVDVKLINPISPSPQGQANNDTDNNNNQTGKPQEPPPKVSDASVDSHLARIPYAGIIGSYFLNNNYIANHVSGINRSGSFTYGLKFNFPSQLFASYQTWDITAHFTFTAPQGYHSNLAIFLEMQILFFLDAIMNNNGFLFIGLGPTVNRWHLKKDEMSATQAKLNFGGIVSFHLGIHLGSVVLKIEPRYYIGSANSLAILAGFQKVL